MADDTGTAPAPSLEDLRAAFIASLAPVARANTQGGDPVTLDEAQTTLAAAQAWLACAEGPYWELQHAQSALNGLCEAAEHNGIEALRAAAATAIPAAEARLAAAQADFDAHPSNPGTDEAAQAVVHAREAVIALGGEVQ